MEAIKSGRGDGRHLVHHHPCDSFVTRGRRQAPCIFQKLERSSIYTYNGIHMKEAKQEIVDAHKNERKGPA